MARQFSKMLRSACYRTGSRTAFFIGLGLIILGVLLLIFFVPLWAYLAVIGITLIALGIFLIVK